MFTSFREVWWSHPFPCTILWVFENEVTTLSVYFWKLDQKTLHHICLPNKCMYPFSKKNCHAKAGFALHKHWPPLATPDPSSDASAKEIMAIPEVVPSYLIASSDHYHMFFSLLFFPLHSLGGLELTQE